MRSITRQAVTAFNSFHTFRASNTQVTIEKEVTKEYATLSLHGHPIAIHRQDLITGECHYDITNANYFTNVTKERLNGIPGVNIYQKNHVWYLNDTPWDGSWITI